MSCSAIISVWMQYSAAFGLSLHVMLGHRFFSDASLNCAPLQSVIAARDFLRNCRTVALRGARVSMKAMYSCSY